MTLLFVACPRGHRLAKVVAVRDVGPVVLVDTRRGRRVFRLADLLGGTVTVDQGSQLTIDDAAPTSCACGPTHLPGAWLRGEIAAGRRSSVWRRI